jgi:hypothetical protein
MTATLIPIAAFLHVLGAVIGAGLATFSEITYLQAAADGRIDHHERKYLRRLFHGLHVGMALVLFSGFALVVLEYLVPDAQQQVLFAPFWAVQTLALILLMLGALLSRHLIKWRFASAAILGGWWVLLLADLGYLNSLHYFGILMIFVIVSFILVGVLQALHVLIKSAQKDALMPY